MWDYTVRTVALLPVLIATTSVLADRWYPVSDWALIEIHTADVYSSSPPLVGIYSRFALNHPGPAQFWITAPIYQALGRLPIGLLVAAGAIASISIVCALGSAQRRGGRILLTTVGASLFLFEVLGLRGPALIDPWNPYFGFFPFVCAGIIAWEIAEGDLSRLWRYVIWSSIAAHAHVMYLLPGMMMGVVALLVGIGFRRREIRRLGLRCWTFAALATAVMWALPLLQQLRGPRGNLSALARAVSAHGASQQAIFGIEAALRQLSRTLTLGDLGGAGNRQGISGFGEGRSGLLLIGVLVTLALLAAASGRRWQEWSVTRSLSVSLVGLGGVILSVSLIIGPPYSWLLLPLWVGPLWLYSLSGWMSVRLLIARYPRLLSGLTALVCKPWWCVATLALAGLGAGVLSETAAPPHAEWSTAAEQLCEPAATWLRAHGYSSATVQTRGDEDFYFFTFGCMATWIRDGIDARTTMGGGIILPSHEAGPAASRPAGVPIVVIATGWRALADSPRGDVIGAFTPTAGAAQAGIPPARIELVG